MIPVCKCFFALLHPLTYIGGSESGGSGTSDDKDGVSTTTLGGAIGGTAAGMLLLFGLLAFLAKKRGWIVSRNEVQMLVEERIRNEESKMLLEYPERGGAQKDGGIVQAHGSQIHQMP